MINVTATDLEKHNIDLKGKFTINIKGKTFRKETILSKKVKNKIPQIAKEYHARSLEVIVVEHELFFSIWVANKIDNINKITEEEDNQDEISKNQQSVKKVVRYYRGISYEVEVPEYIPQNDSPSQLDKKRKFRGQEY